MIKPNFTEITGENQFTPKYVFNEGYFSVDIRGDFVGTVTLQKSYDKGKTWYDTDNFIEPITTYGINSEDHVYYKLGVKTGEYKSGTINARIGQ